MKSKVTKIIAIILFGALSLFGLSTLPATSTVSAVKAGCEKGVPEAVKEANNCEDAEKSDGISNIVTVILNAVIGISGLIAVVFVIIGGVQYMTSTGDAGKVEKAKKTIIYALIGLAVCALAFAIVNLVARTTNKATGSYLPKTENHIAFIEETL